jgi:hypothetical protein
MEIKEIVSYFLNAESNILEVSFRTIGDSDDVLISFLNEYYEVNPKSLPKPEYY